MAKHGGRCPRGGKTSAISAISALSATASCRLRRAAVRLVPPCMRCARPERRMGMSPAPVFPLSACSTAVTGVGGGSRAVSNRVADVFRRPACPGRRGVARSSAMSAECPRVPRARGGGRRGSAGSGRLGWCSVMCRGGYWVRGGLFRRCSAVFGTVFRTTCVTMRSDAYSRLGLRIVAQECGLVHYT